MDKILEISDVFGLDAQNLKWVLLIPLTIMVGAVAVFVFGFKKTESPKFRKLVSASSNNSIGGAKRKKRDTAGAWANASASAASGKPAKRQEAPIQKAATAVVSSSSKPLATLTTAEVTVHKRTPERKQNVVTKVAPTGKTANKTAKATKNTNNAKKITTVTVKQQQQAHDKENDGEWQTVITKKQKKQIEQPTIAEVADKTVKSKKEHSPKQQIKKSPKITVVAVPSVALAEETKQQQQKEEAKPAAEARVEVTALAEHTVKQQEIVASNNVANVAGNNVAFDELGDAAWTETKPQRKSNRALREH